MRRALTNRLGAIERLLSRARLWGPADDGSEGGPPAPPLLPPGPPLAPPQCDEPTLPGPTDPRAPGLADPLPTDLPGAPQEAPPWP